MTAGITATPTRGVALSTPHSSTAYIASRWYDGLFIILSPLLALGIAELLPAFEYPFQDTSAFGSSGLRIVFLISLWTSSHLLAVFFRSHLNPDIFPRHRFRFVALPLLLFAAMMTSTWVHVFCFVLAILWDVYHSSMQNFGFCRIYDSRAGNDPRTGRRLDYWLNHVLYIGPILAGYSLFATIGCIRRFSTVGWGWPREFLATVETHHSDLRLAVILLGVAFLGFYLWCYRRFVKQGYRVSRQKIALLASVGLSSIIAWGFLPPIEAFFVANFYHALQYFAIVWWMERKNIRKVLHLSRIRPGQWLALLAFAGVLLVLGAGKEYATRSSLRWATSLAMVVSLMHFYYDSFIWSVRKRQV